MSVQQHISHRLITHTHTHTHTVQTLTYMDITTRVYSTLTKPLYITQANVHYYNNCHYAELTTSAHRHCLLSTKKGICHLARTKSTHTTQGASDKS